MPVHQAPGSTLPPRQQQQQQQQQHEWHQWHQRQQKQQQQLGPAACGGTASPQAAQALGAAPARAVSYGSTGDRIQKGQDTEAQEDYSLKKADQFKYEGILVTSSMMGQGLNDVWFFRRHFQRSGESENLLRNVASPQEREYLQGIDKSIPPVLVNMMVWRRSLLKVLGLCMMVTTCTLVFGSYRDYLTAYKEANMPEMTAKFVEWTREQERFGNKVSFSDYSISVMHEIRRLMMGQAVIVQALGEVVAALLNVLSLGMIIRASMTWGNFRLSRTLVMNAWFLSVAAPFLVSMAPARLWVHWARADTLVNVYQDELSAFLGTEQQIKNVLEFCAMIRSDGETKVERGTDMLERICGIVDKMPNRNVTVPTGKNVFKWKKVDFAPAHKSCKQAREIIKQGKPYEALKQAKRGCSIAEITLDKTGGYEQTDEMMKYISNKLKAGAEASIATFLAFKNLGTIFPAALSIAPGLLKGAVRMKMLVPQSNIPGMFVLILPWLYCPLTWCMYSIMFQAVGNCTLLIGMLLLAFNPAIYAFLGSYYQLDQPLRDDEVIYTIGRLRTAQLVVSLVAYACLALFVLHLFRTYAARQHYWGYLEDWGVDASDDWGSEAEAAWMEEVYEKTDFQTFIKGNAITIILFICSVLKAFLLTSAAGMDWMCGQMVGFRRVERSVNSFGQVSFEIISEYNSRMDHLVSLDTSGQHAPEDVTL
eukprot:CAMPEP_0179041450 /NCGR_PEP_ID=MMETSP0796-20121207/16162_1 /TAXON_ID=73915 /ORGANISM="Pyrodinium bahamense, Strain pbaha01" /LENGTH=705 /DNA_ID=CAMNT_0020737813 /DNA_START=65 /DNA_END=2182 /DNA_ORIENTATION=-